MATTSVDLTPFGFTSTENLVYNRLVAGGPAGGYAIARDLLIARANVYQALRGLVAKGGAAQIDGEPARFRAVTPMDLYASIVDQSARKLDGLERQLAGAHVEGQAMTVPVNGDRALVELATRVLVREREPVTLLTPARLQPALTPALRKRAVDGGATDTWIISDAPPGSDISSIQLDRVRALLGLEALILLAGSSVLLARFSAGETSGYWTSDPLLCALARGAVAALLGDTP